MTNYIFDHTITFECIASFNISIQRAQRAYHVVDIVASLRSPVGIGTYDKIICNIPCKHRSKKETITE